MKSSHDSFDLVLRLAQIRKATNKVGSTIQSTPIAYWRSGDSPMMASQCAIKRRQKNRNADLEIQRLILLRGRLGMQA